jgi:hypothetical protein
MHIIAHNLLSDEHVELTLAVSHPPQEKNRWFKRSPYNEEFDLI